MIPAARFAARAGRLAPGKGTNWGEARCRDLEKSKHRVGIKAWVAILTPSFSVDVCALPKNKALVEKLEMKLRQSVPAEGLQMEKENMQVETWNIGSLFKALKALDMVASGQANATIVGGTEQTIQLTMAELGGLPIIIAVTGEQIIVDSLLVEAEDVKDPAAFNAAVLRSRDLFPLSSIGLEQLPDGRDVYSIFGALSSSSSISNIVTEIDTLIENIQRATEVFADFFNIEAA
ncbi:TPA: DUF2170 family protein [Pseudomonas aeruginosa]|nr:DUF2170 family protein [Pseudomonas aeruginosa]